MTKPLALHENQVRAIIRAARKEGYAAIVQVGKVWVRLVPEDHAIPPQDEGRIDDEEDVRL